MTICTEPTRADQSPARLGWVDPTVEDLEAFEAEWPLIAADLAFVTVYCDFLANGELDSRRPTGSGAAGQTGRLSPIRPTSEVPR
jgi:hypothetical protein